MRVTQKIRIYPFGLPSVLKTDNMVRFGIIGTNNISDWFIAGAKMDPRFTISCVYSRTREKGTAFAAKYGVEKVFTTFEQMLEHIDAVYIATPNYIHAEQSLFFIRNGKAVLCEKPLCSNAREGRMVIEQAKKYGVPFMEAMISTLNPNFLELRERLPQIGRIRKYFSSYCQYSSRYDKYKSGIIENAFKRELSNGALVDIGIYTIYPMVVLFGRPVSIKAVGTKLETGVDAQGTVVFEYGNSMEATVVYSKVADSYLPTEVQGEEGTLYMEKINIPRTLTLRQRGGNPIDVSPAHCGNDYFYEARDFMDMIEKKQIEHEINSFENSIITLEIMDEIRRQVGVEYPADIM